MSRRGWAIVAVACVTAATTWLTATRLRLSSDLSALFPSSGEAAALARWTHAFGGRDPAIVLVRGSRAADVEAVADAVSAGLARSPSIVRVLDRSPELPSAPDPTLAWAYAGPEARARLALAVTAPGMQARLDDTRAMLLAPGGGQDLEAWLARDPLRLAQIPWEAPGAGELLSGVGSAPGAPLSADEGRARLVIAEPRGSAFESDSARALVGDVERVLQAAARPGVTTELAGGHAIAWATERLLRRDLEASAALSTLLASLAFVATFRRARALVAVLPPLALGTLWTTGLAALVPSGLDALAIAFAAVVVGVGVDTGVHVYAALLASRRAGLHGAEAAAAARRATWRPTLVAAAVAATAFASLGLSGLRSMRELGLLCGAGELLTAVAILLLTPELGAWLERGPPPGASAPRWLEGVLAATATRGRALASLALCALPLGVLAVIGWPRPAEALVAMRPEGLAPLVAEEHVRAAFGGRTREWIVLTEDGDETRARARADRVAEALEPLVRSGVVDGLDTLTTLAPADPTVRARLAERDALDLPGRRAALEAALAARGFDVPAFAGALDGLGRPAAGLPQATGREGAIGWLYARHLAREGDRTLVATYLRPTDAPDAEARVRSAVAAADPESSLTGLDAIERTLHRALGRDLEVVGGAALLLVALAMRAALRSAGHVAVALGALVCEMAVVGVAMRLLGVRWHVFDALVVPVLFGVTVDESMFLLHAARDRTLSEALRAQGPLVASTALTTAAGFAALVICRFEGLRDLGEVGAVGVLAGLVASLVVVPGALRLGGHA